ncbi:Hypp5013 [Branchiostoma lanceolatum]|uniref:Hypp5013 protein n=2 Tax=Branchiostoma lanceolatum TaxID=7740 RepID=A0A8K0ACC9_BRALA|nr:Hypp5013 [Branchiostoma lanceolatum]
MGVQRRGCCRRSELCHFRMSTGQKLAADAQPRIQSQSDVFTSGWGKTGQKHVPVRASARYIPEAGADLKIITTFQRSSGQKMSSSQIALAVGVAVVLTTLPPPCQSCKVADWQPMSFSEQVAAAEIAVYARVLDKVNGTYGYWPMAYRGVLRVYCVFKGGPLPSNLIVDEMGQLTSCHHTKVDIGEDYILLLKRDGDMFLPDEVNYLSVAFPADQEHFEQVSRTCGLQNFTAPVSSDLGLQPRCAVNRTETGSACLGGADGFHRGSYVLLAAVFATLSFTQALLV